jgi:hypothetical protein
MHFIETKATSRLCNVCHLSFKYLWVVCMAAAASGAKYTYTYFISADFFQVNNISYSQWCERYFY